MDTKYDHILPDRLGLSVVMKTLIGNTMLAQWKVRNSLEQDCTRRVHADGVILGMVTVLQFIGLSLVEVEALRSEMDRMADEEQTNAGC